MDADLVHRVAVMDAQGLRLVRAEHAWHRAALLATVWLLTPEDAHG